MLGASERAPTVQLPKMPMARMGRVSLFEREVQIGLSSAAIELLFREVDERVEVYADRMIRSASTSFPFPAVIRLTRRFAHRKVRKNRKNLLD